MANNPNQPAQLENLFSFVSPKQLRQSLTRVFMNYLIYSKNELTDDLDQISEDFYFLIQFLEDMENKD